MDTISDQNRQLDKVTQKHTYTHTHTHKHTHRNTHRHTDTHTHIPTQTHTHRHTDTQTHIHTDTHTHIHTDTQTHRHTHTRTHARITHCPHAQGENPKAQTRPGARVSKDYCSACGDRMPQGQQVQASRGPRLRRMGCSLLPPSP